MNIFSKKTLNGKKLLQYAILLILLGTIAALGRTIYMMTPSLYIHGLYQSDIYDGMDDPEGFSGRLHYDAQFYGDQFYIERWLAHEMVRLCEGTFQRAVPGGNQYLLRDDLSGQVFMIELGHGQFKFYDPVHPRVVTFHLIAANDPGTEWRSAIAGGESK